MSRPITMAAPVPPLNMEEVKFWLEIMREHALFIKMGLPCESTSLISEAESFYKEFGALYNRAEKIASEKKFVELVDNALDTVAEFLRFKRHLLQQVLLCKLIGNNPPLFLDHMAREAEYVLALFGKIKECHSKNYHLSKARENVFWLRIMADHTKFIEGHIDPSERIIMNMVRDFSTEFDNLFLQANDFYSMLQHPSQLPLVTVSSKKKCKKKHQYTTTTCLPHLNPPVYGRFIHDVRSATLRLRDFKKALYNMVENCRIASILPALLADHVRREADHFLMILTMMEKGLIGTEGDYLQPDLDENALTLDDLCDNADDSTASLASQYISSTDDDDCEDDDDDCDDDDDDCDCDCDDEEDDDDDDDEDDDDDDCASDIVFDDDRDEDFKPASQKKANYLKPKFYPRDDEPVVQAESAAQSTKAADPEKADGKYKWSGKWPRPLGKTEE